MHAPDGIGIASAKDEKARRGHRQQRYFGAEPGPPLGRFDAGFLPDCLPRETGAHGYNRGVRAAQVVLAARLDDVQDAPCPRTARGGRPVNAPGTARAAIAATAG